MIKYWGKMETSTQTMELYCNKHTIDGLPIRTICLRFGISSHIIEMWLKQLNQIHNTRMVLVEKHKQSFNEWKKN